MTPIELIQQLARSVEVGHTGRIRDIPRTEMIDRCRLMCEEHGLSYAESDLTPTNLTKVHQISTRRLARSQVVKSKVSRKPDARPYNRNRRPCDLAGVQCGDAGSGEAKTES